MIVDRYNLLRDEMALKRRCGFGDTSLIIVERRLFGFADAMRALVPVTVPRVNSPRG
jgi:hypothetical protein